MCNKIVIGDLAYPEYYFDPVTPKVKVHVQKAAGLLSMFYAALLYVLFAADWNCPTPAPAPLSPEDKIRLATLRTRRT